MYGIGLGMYIYVGTYQFAVILSYKKLLSLLTYNVIFFGCIILVSACSVFSVLKLSRFISCFYCIPEFHLSFGVLSEKKNSANEQCVKAAAGIYYNVKRSPDSKILKVNYTVPTLPNPKRELH